MSLLEQDTIRKGREFSVPKFEPGDDKEYKVEAILDIIVYSKEENGHLPGLYYCVVWKDYLKKENTWKSSLVIIHFRKLVSNFHKNYPEKPTAISSPLDSALLMAKPTIQLSTKRKQGQPTGCAKKRAKWGNKEEFESVWLSRAKSWQEIKDLSPWHKEYQRACSCNLIICNSTLLRAEQYHISTTSLLNQVSSLTTYLWFFLLCL